MPLLIGISTICMSLVIYKKNNPDIVLSDSCVCFGMLLVFIHPLAMTHLSYRFDSVFMMIALGIPFLLFSIKNEEKYWITFGIAMISAMVIMSLYQAVICMCFILMFIDLFFHVQEVDFIQYLKNNIVRLCGFCVGMLVYLLIIGPHFIDKEGWRQKASQIDLSLSKESLQLIGNRFVGMCEYLMNYIGGTSLCYQIGLGILLIVAEVFLVIMTVKRRGEKGWIWKGIIMIMSPVIVLILTFLPLIVLTNYGIRARLFLCFGGVLFFLFLVLQRMPVRLKVFSNIILICIMFGQFSCMYVYGNALNCQKEYEEYLVAGIVRDVEEINCDQEYKKLTFIGAPPKSRQLEVMCHKYPFFEEIVPQYINNDTWIGGAYVYHYMQEGLEICGTDDEDGEIVKTEKPVEINSLYGCYLNGNKIIVKFNEE